MIEVESSIVIRRPIDEIFAFLSDVTNEPRWNPGNARGQARPVRPRGADERLRRQAQAVHGAIRLHDEGERNQEQQRGDKHDDLVRADHETSDTSLDIHIKDLSDLLDERAKRLRVSVRSAVPLTEEQSEKLRQTIGQSTGLEVMLAAKVDASLLGGMIVQVGDKVFDSSVRTRIEAIRNQLLARSSYEIQAGRDRFSSRG